MQGKAQSRTAPPVMSSGSQNNDRGGDGDDGSVAWVYMVAPDDHGAFTRRCEALEDRLGPGLARPELNGALGATLLLAASAKLSWMFRLRFRRVIPCFTMAALPLWRATDRECMICPITTG
jgi:hypothetical protein